MGVCARSGADGDDGDGDDGDGDDGDGDDGDGDDGDGDDGDGDGVGDGDQTSQRLNQCTVYKGLTSAVYS